MSLRDIVARMATDSQYAEYVHSHVDTVAAEHDLSADEVSRLRSLTPSGKTTAPVVLGARLSKSGIGSGIFALASHPMIQDHRAAGWEGTDPNASRDAEAASHHQTSPP